MDEKETNLPATTKKKTLKNNEDDRKWFSFPNSPASNTVISVVSHVGDLETRGREQSGQCRRTARAAAV